MSLWQRTKHWFLGLDRRERITVSIGATAVALMLFYVAVAEPLMSARATWQRRVNDDAALVSWMRSAVVEMHSLRGLAHTAPDVRQGESLFGTVDRTARSTALGPAIKRLQPDGSNRVRVQLEAAPFDALIRWLGALQAGYAVHVDAVSVDRADAPGTVNAQITLSRGS